MTCPTWQHIYQRLTGVEGESVGSKTGLKASQKPTLSYEFRVPQGDAPDAGSLPCPPCESLLGVKAELSAAEHSAQMLH